MTDRRRRLRLLSRRVVITGIGCVSPNGVGREAFAEACLSGKSGLKRPDFGDDPYAAGLRTNSVGRVSDEQFDPTDHVDAADLKRVPRVVPLALAAAREAMGQAGLEVGDIEASRRVGLVLGSGGGGLAFVEGQYEKHFGGRSGGSPFAITGGTHGNLAGELSIALGLRGPSHVISTGCASSTDALGYAKLLIQAGLCDAVVCGGADAPIAPGILRGFERMGVISTTAHDDPTRASRPFSATRDGLVLAEGAWMFVVEAEGRSEALAEIAGYGSTCDAYHRVRIDPSLEECVRAIELALREAGAGADEVDYVNLHGTGTELNDRLETLAMKRLLGERAASVPMSATKSLIGHPQGAGGAAGVAATILCGGRRKAHPTINLDDPDPACDLDYVPHTAREVDATLVVCNCIAFGSKNSALALRLSP